MLWIKEVEMVNSVDDLESSCSVRLRFLLSSCSTRGLHQSWIKLSGILTSRKRSVWRNKKLKKLIDSFAEDRSLTWSMTASGSPASMNPCLIMPTCLRLFFETTIFRSSIQDGMKFCCGWNNSYLMISWKVCTKFAHESLINSRLFLNSMTWKFTTRSRRPIIKNWRQWWKDVLSKIWDHRILRLEMGELRQAASGILVKNQRVQRRVHKGQGECWQWNANGQSSKGDKCSFPHDEDKRAKFAPPPAPSPEPSTPQDVRNPARTKSPRGRSPSLVYCARIILKVLVRIHLVKSGILQSALPVPQDKRGMQIREKCTFTHRQVDYSLGKSLKGMVTKVLWPYWRIHDNRLAYVKLWSRRNLRRFYGRAQTYGNQSDVFNPPKPSYVMQTIETKTNRLEWFAQVILISATPTLQNLRIGLCKRRTGKKQRGG